MKGYLMSSSINCVSQLYPTPANWRKLHSPSPAPALFYTVVESFVNMLDILAIPVIFLSRATQSMMSLHRVNSANITHRTPV